MQNNQYLVREEDVIVILGEPSKVAPFHTICAEDFIETIRQYIQIYIQNNKRISQDLASEITSAWIENQGVSCKLLIPDHNWKQGHIKLALIFEPEEEDVLEIKEMDSPLDDIRQSIINNLEENNHV